MNENIDLTKILKNCPKGTKLYTPIWGEVTFIEIKKNKDCLYPICIYTNPSCSYTNLTKDGRYLINKKGTECILFPSKEQRDWSKFTAPWYKKETGTIDTIEKQGEQASSQINERSWLYLVSDVLTWKDGIGQYLDDQRVQELAKKLCSKYAQKLYNSSVLSNSSNPGENKQKFDPKTLKPFDKILVKRYDNIWVATLLSHSETHTYGLGISYLEFTTINNGIYESCIPYNEDTKHLVGTNEEAPEYYKYWKE